MSGTTAPMGQNEKPSSVDFLSGPLAEIFEDPALHRPAIGASLPKTSFASARRWRVIASSRSVVSRSAAGEVGISSGTQMSLPISRWNESVSVLVMETCP